jgi:hypothetical protein
MNGWTDVQMQMFQRAYMDEVDEARLAHKVIPEYSLASSARSVSIDQFDYAPPGIVDDISQISLEERQELFNLTRAQSEDEDLSSAQVIARRAAQQLAREDDIRVFRTAIRDPISNAPRGSVNFQDIVDVQRRPDASGEPTGDGLPPAVAAAVAALDGDGYRSGYVMVLGPYLYRLLYTRAPGAADLPVVAVRGLLGDGPVHRCTVLDNLEALVLSVGAGRIDRAVAVSPVAEFLRVEQIQVVPPPAPSEEIRMWRLYERFITRFKERRSVVLLRLLPP